MPFVFDYSETGWPEDNSPPRVDQFVYLPAPEFGGVRDPVHFTLDVPPEPRTVPYPRQGIWGRLFGRPAKSVKAWRESRDARDVFFRQRLLAVSVPMLRNVDVRRLYG